MPCWAAGRAGRRRIGRRGADAVRRPRARARPAARQLRRRGGRPRAGGVRRGRGGHRQVAACWRSFAPSSASLPRRLGRGPLRVLRRDDRLSPPHRRVSGELGGIDDQRRRGQRARQGRPGAVARSGTTSRGRGPSCATSLGLDADDPAVAALDSASRRSETFRAFKAITLRVAERVPLVLVVEDLHWIDPASEEYLAFIADVVPDDARAARSAPTGPGYRPSVRRSQLPRARHPAAALAARDRRHHRRAARHDRHSARGRRAHRGQGGGQSRSSSRR